MERRADIAVVGGSGLYALVDGAEPVEVDTPFGAPSAPIQLADVDGRRVAFLPRHGVHHQFPAHRINARANVWALHALGVRRVYGPCAAGSLRPSITPGQVVICDQLVDLARRPDGTFYDGPVTHHLAFADPYCPVLSAAIVDAGRRCPDTDVVEGGTVVVIPGPRFSTRAESRWYRAQGWDVVNMTQAPEAALCRELGMCYSTMALITDHDAGVEGDPGVEPVSEEAVFRFFAENIERLRALLFATLQALPPEPAPCGCAAAGGERPPA